MSAALDAIVSNIIPFMLVGVIIYVLWKKYADYSGGGNV